MSKRAYRWSDRRNLLPFAVGLAVGVGSMWYFPMGTVEEDGSEAGGEAAITDPRPQEVIEGDPWSGGATLTASIEGKTVQCTASAVEVLEPESPYLVAEIEVEGLECPTPEVTEQIGGRLLRGSTYPSFRIEAVKTADYREKYRLADHVVLFRNRIMIEPVRLNLGPEAVDLEAKIERIHWEYQVGEAAGVEVGDDLTIQVRLRAQG